MTDIAILEHVPDSSKCEREEAQLDLNTTGDCVVVVVAKKLKLSALPQSNVETRLEWV